MLRGAARGQGDLDPPHRVVREFCKCCGRPPGWRNNYQQVGGRRRFQRWPAGRPRRRPPFPFCRHSFAAEISQLAGIGDRKEGAGRHRPRSPGSPGSGATHHVERGGDLAALQLLEPVALRGKAPPPARPRRPQSDAGSSCRAGDRAVLPAPRPRSAPRNRRKVRSEQPSNSAASAALNRPPRTRSWISSKRICRTPCSTSVRRIPPLLEGAGLTRTDHLLRNPDRSRVTDTAAQTDCRHGSTVLRSWQLVSCAGRLTRWDGTTRGPAS